MPYLPDTVLFIVCTLLALLVVAHHRRVIRGFGSLPKYRKGAERSLQLYAAAIGLMLSSWFVGWYRNEGEPIGFYGIVIFAVFALISFIAATSVNSYAPDTTSPSAP